MCASYCPTRVAAARCSGAKKGATCCSPSRRSSTSASAAATMAPSRLSPPPEAAPTTLPSSPPAASMCAMLNTSRARSAAASFRVSRTSEAQSSIAHSFSTVSRSFSSSPPPARVQCLLGQAVGRSGKVGNETDGWSVGTGSLSPLHPFTQHQNNHAHTHPCSLVLAPSSLRSWKSSCSRTTVSACRSTSGSLCGVR